MLQVKNLVKRYTTKGETVTALDHISVDFPEKGMVFLLGKSGSGKSTLLNVSGGLDSPDEGEVIVKGKSSKDFTPSDFDSYRNTYLGFIFQEYNILNELTVAENLALAVELQGKPREKEVVDSILEKVDLKGYGDRRPNTLSGGQKQRVAIARALIKNPEIIMADEPTGALDSSTGMQVFDTLKKLSEEKLVVVVSHDREFAERYADRIIELKDGKIVSDMSRSGEETFVSNLIEGEKSLTVACGAALSEEETQKVVSFLKRHKGSVVISAQEQAAQAERKAVFSETKAEEKPREEDTSNFLRSKFPMRYAVKMGISGLKFKPVRLVFTTLLATIAFIVFGIFSTLITYNEQEVCATTLYSSDFVAAVLQKKGYRYSKSTNADAIPYFPVNRGQRLHFDEHDIAIIEAEHPEMEFVPMFDFDLGTFELKSSMMGVGDASYGSTAYYSNTRILNGFARASDIQSKTSFVLKEGRWPQPATSGRSEVVISTALFEAFCCYGYCAADEIPLPVKSFSDLEGKLIAAVSGPTRIYLTVVGLLDTGEDFSAYDGLKDGSGDFGQEEIELFGKIFRYSFSSLGIVADSFYEENKDVDVAPLNYDGAMREARRMGWQTSYQEDVENSLLYAGLYSTLNVDRKSRCNTLMSYQREVDETRDVYYFTPYEFTWDIAAGEMTLNTLFSLVGPAAAILAVFAALLLFNFISASINAKKKDIGVLRAVGARGIDVFKIFMVEGLAITLLSFVLGCLGSLAACAIANSVMIDLKVLTYPFFLFGWANMLIVLAVALVTAAISTTVPVFLTVRKKPVEAIRSI